MASASLRQMVVLEANHSDGSAQALAAPLCGFVTM
jgi:hypothetical protein